VFSFLVTEADSFNDLSVANQGSVFLKTGVGAKAIACVYLKINEPRVTVLPVLALIGAGGFTLPFDLRAVRIDQIRLHPIPDNFFVELWEGTALRRIDRDVLLAERVERRGRERGAEQK
jgi:hypothetical protein